MAEFRITIRTEEEGAAATATAIQEALDGIDGTVTVEANTSGAEESVGELEGMIESVEGVVDVDADTSGAEDSVDDLEGMIDSVEGTVFVDADTSGAEDSVDDLEGMIDSIEGTVFVDADTSAAVESIDSGIGGALRSAATTALGIGAAIATGVATALLQTEERFRNLRINTGSGGLTAEAERELLASLVTGGRDADDATNAIAAISGQGAALGVGLENRGVARTLSDAETVGVSSQSALQALTNFGASGPGEVYGAVNIGSVAAIAANQDPGALIEALRIHGPTLKAFGLNFLESAAFLIDLQTVGVDPVARRIGVG